MKQKILYIILMITAFLGRGEMVWAQEAVEGYNGPYFDINKTTASMDYANWSNKDKKTYTYKCNEFLTFSIYNENGIEVYNIGAMGYRYGSFNATLNWAIKLGYYIQINYLSCKAYQTTAGANKQHSINGNAIKTGGITKNKATTAESHDLNLSNTDEVNIILGSTVSYITNISATYTISHYTLKTDALETAITTATNALNTITDVTMNRDLQTAITNANADKDFPTFLEACAFPNSYWNGSSEGRAPSEVTDRANKLNAITNYLLARTAANVYAEEDVPNAVYEKLHPYDYRNPNDYTTDEVNGATAEINIAIELAETTTEEYKKAKKDIEIAAARTDHNDAETLDSDVSLASKALEAATTVDMIETALDKIRDFDKVTFSGPFSIEDGVTIKNPASARSEKVISYSSSDETIIQVEGTTLRALKPGPVSITASTSTDDRYYGYTATQTYTVTKEMILRQSDNCPLVTNVPYPSITLERTFFAGHNTLTLPFDTNISDFSSSEDAYAAQLSLVTLNSQDGYTLYFEIVDGGNMMANQPYVVNLPTVKESFVWENITVAEISPVTKTNEQRYQGWTMQGNYTRGFSMKGNYGIAGGKLSLGVAGSTINAYTAYFIPPTTQNIRTRVAILDEWGNATFIGEVKDGVLQTEEGIFGLDGVRQNELRKGVNIVKTKDGTVRKVLK